MASIRIMIAKQIIKSLPFFKLFVLMDGSGGVRMIFTCVHIFLIYKYLRCAANFNFHITCSCTKYYVLPHSGIDSF